MKSQPLEIAPTPFSGSVNPSISPSISPWISPLEVVHAHCQQKLDAAREQLETVWEEVLQQVRRAVVGNGEPSCGFSWNFGI